MGSLLMAGADGTAVSLEHLHETGSEKGGVCLRYTDVIHRHLASKYRHIQHRANHSRADKTCMSGNEDLAFALAIRQHTVLCQPGNYISASSRMDSCM